MKRFLCALALICLFLGGALLGFEQIALNPTVYDRIQAELNIYDYVGVSHDALPRVNAVLADYMRGAREDIDIEEELFGVRQQVFHADEKAHMVDVAFLFRLERGLRTALLSVGGALLIVSVLLCGRQLLRVSWRALGLAALLLLLLAALVVLLWTCVGFDRLFLLFHQLLFTNDLWLMNPATDAMIRMFPAEFFRQIVRLCGANALALGLAFPSAAQLLLTVAGLLIRNHSGREQTP